MDLYKVTLRFGHDFYKSIDFLVVAKDILIAETAAKEELLKYGYDSSSRLHGVELLASEGQYAPNILLLTKEKQIKKF